MILFGLPWRRRARTSLSRGVRRLSALSCSADGLDPFCRSYANLITALAGTNVPPAATHCSAAAASGGSRLVGM